MHKCFEGTQETRCLSGLAVNLQRPWVQLQQSATQQQQQHHNTISNTATTTTTTQHNQQHNKQTNKQENCNNNGDNNSDNSNCNKNNYFLLQCDLRQSQKLVKELVQLSIIASLNLPLIKDFAPNQMENYPLIV